LSGPFISENEDENTDLAHLKIIRLKIPHLLLVSGEENANVALKTAIQLSHKLADCPLQKPKISLNPDMEQSRTITRKSASNLALAFVLLPKAKRDAMSALYAFCREVDDVADDETVPVEKRRTQLALWRSDILQACQNGQPQFIVNQEFKPVIAQYKLPFEYFDDLIRGVEMDLDIKRYETFDDLEKYCYRVASVVGLLSIEIFGYTNPACREYAIYLGKALQLTNILRDVKTDAERGRIYLPNSEMVRSNVSAEEIFRGEYSKNYCELARSVAQRARHFYQLARETLPAADRKSMVAAELMGAVYWRLLRKLERENFNVFGPHPTRINKPQKLFLILQTWFRMSSGRVAANYGTS
jgi:15-cis-phytoene synthase